MTPLHFRFALYCWFASANALEFSAVAQDVGRWIGERGGELIYGGGKTGLMGTVAEATRTAGGRVVGISPKALVDKELANTLCDELHVVDTMHERKAMMAERADAFIALHLAASALSRNCLEIWTWRSSALPRQAHRHPECRGLLRRTARLPRPQRSRGIHGRLADAVGAGRETPRHAAQALMEESMRKPRGAANSPELL